MRSHLISVLVTKLGLNRRRVSTLMLVLWSEKGEQKGEAIKQSNVNEKRKVIILCAVRGVVCEQTVKLECQIVSIKPVCF